MEYTEDELAREQWRPIPGFGELYLISDLGRVKSMPRYVNAPNGPRLTPERLLVVAPNTKGYARVYLSIGLCRARTFKVHQLVMAAFVGPVPDGMVVCHNDDDKMNPRLSNLRYDTQAENMRDATRNGVWERRSRHIWEKRTHCQNGHAFPEVTYTPGAKRGRCNECRRDYRAKRRAAA